MKLEVKPCGENDTELIWEKAFEQAPTEENAEQETLVFKAIDDNGAFIGGCVLGIDQTKAAEFERLWVAERYRARGVGSALIRTAEQAARERGCRTVLNAYCFDFQKAKPLFERLGYRLIGVAKDWPKGHEGYTLIKTLKDIPRESVSAELFGQAGFAVVPGSDRDGASIASELEAYNRAFAPRSHEYFDTDKKIVNEKGEIVAGCIAGVSGWDTLHIDAFWADEDDGGNGAGEYLLCETEREAKQMGAYLSRAEGTERQAAFFKKHGYTVCVVFEDEPKWFVMYKRL